jgi:hypothetical protein
VSAAVARQRVTRDARDTRDAPDAPARLDVFEALERILRRPGEIAAACVAGGASRSLAVTSLAAIAVGMALFGGVVGSMRGGAQIAYGSLKMPLAILATLVACVPAFHAFAAALGRPWTYRAVASLTLVAGARASLALVAAAPALWLVINFGAGYHAIKLLATLAYALAGLAALGLMLRALGEGPRRASTAAAFVAVFLLVGGQMAWSLRPFIVRPDATEVVFLVRTKEGGLVHELRVSAEQVFLAGRPARGPSAPEPERTP